MSKVFIILGVGLLTAVSWSCGGSSADAERDRIKLARVHNRTLYLDDLEGLFPLEATASDSTVIINGYTRRWIREALLLHDAERNFPKDINIDELVRDYRASLILYHYEKALVDTIDKDLKEGELEAFYEKNKERYQLDKPIIQCQFVKVPRPVPQANLLRELWNSTAPEDHEKLVNYSTAYAERFILTDSTWHDLEDIAGELPKGTLTDNNARSKMDFSQRDENYQYYLRINGIKNKKEIAPLGYIEDQARKFVLHQRKQKLLEQKKEELYNEELRRNNIEIADLDD